MAGLDDRNEVIVRKLQVLNIDGIDISFVIQPIPKSDGYSVIIYNEVKSNLELQHLIDKLSDTLNIYIERYVTLGGD